MRGVGEKLCVKGSTIQVGVSKKCTQNQPQPLGGDDQKYT